MHLELEKKTEEEQKLLKSLKSLAEANTLRRAREDQPDPEKSCLEGPKKVLNFVAKEEQTHLEKKYEILKCVVMTATKYRMQIQSLCRNDIHSDDDIPIIEKVLSYLTGDLNLMEKVTKDLEEHMENMHTQYPKEDEMQLLLFERLDNLEAMLRNMRSLKTELKREIELVKVLMEKRKREHLLLRIENALAQGTKVLALAQGAKVLDKKDPSLPT